MTTKDLLYHLEAVQVVVVEQDLSCFEVKGTYFWVLDKIEVISRPKPVNCDDNQLIEKVWEEEMIKTIECKRLDKSHGSNMNVKFSD